MTRRRLVGVSLVVPDERRLLDQRGRARDDLRRVLARDPAQRRDDRDLQLRPGGVHGGRLVLDGRPRREVRASRSGSPSSPGSASPSPPRSSSGCPRSASEPTTSRSRPSRSARSSGTSRTTGTGSPEAIWACSATPTRGRASRPASTAGSSTSGSLRTSCSPSCSSISYCCSSSPRSSRSSCDRRGGVCSTRSARTRMPPARWARTRSPTSSSHSRIAAALAAIAGYMLAINISILSPANFDPVLTAYGYVIVILGGLGSYLGVVRRVVLPHLHARGDAIPRAPALGRPSGRAPLHDRRGGPDGARRLPAAGAVRQARGADPPCPRLTAPLLEVRDVRKRFAGLHAVDGATFDVGSRHDHRADRSERRRQVDALQRRDGIRARRRRRRPLRRRAPSTGVRRTRSRGSGWSAPSS